MDLNSLLHSYGYALIFAGTFLEGESLLVLGGLFAHRGYLDLGGVIAASFGAALCGDQLFFHLGRRHARGFLARFPRLRNKVNVSLARVERNQVKVVLGMRFLWGLRIALPVALGLSGMSARRFFWLNILSAVLWSCSFACIGFFAGEVFSRLVDDVRAHEKWIAAALLLTGAVVLYLRWHGARRTRPPA
jgi:membrane protein DedA with SNARE-associated domain